MFSRTKKADHNDEKASAPPPPSYKASTAVPSTLSPIFHTRFASLSLHRLDRLRFLRFPPEIVQACEQAVTLAWKRGIHSSRLYGQSHELRLYGSPWFGAGDQATEARRLMCALLRRLHTLGWVMTLSTDISKKKTDKDALLFRFQSPPPAECDWASISFSRQDRIRFIDCRYPNYVFLREELTSSKCRSRSGTS
jgi:hypothetical protein